MDPSRWREVDDLSLRDLARLMYEQLERRTDSAEVDKYRARLLRLVDSAHRAEKYARFGSHAEFLADLTFVRRAVRGSAQYDFAADCRCALVMATVATVYSAVPLDAVAAHLAIGETNAAMNIAAALRFDAD